MSAESIIPLVGFKDLPEGFRFNLNLFGAGVRCRAVLSVACLADLLDAIGVGQCPIIVHQSIFDQEHLGQITFGWMDNEDLPVIVEVLAKHQAEWLHFDR